MSESQLFWVANQFDLPPDIEIPKKPDVWACDLGGFHNRPHTVGWRSLEPDDWVFEPFLLVRKDGHDARFCNDCAGWLDQVFDLRSDEQVSGWTDARR